MFGWSHGALKLLDTRSGSLGLTWVQLSAESKSVSAQQGLVSGSRNVQRPARVTLKHHQLGRITVDASQRHQALSVLFFSQRHRARSLRRPSACARSNHGSKMIHAAGFQIQPLLAGTGPAHLARIPISIYISYCMT